MTTIGDLAIEPAPLCTMVIKEDRLPFCPRRHRPRQPRVAGVGRRPTGRRLLPVTSSLRFLATNVRPIKATGGQHQRGKNGKHQQGAEEQRVILR
jgi:hypothetical protein